MDAVVIGMAGVVALMTGRIVLHLHLVEGRAGIVGGMGLAAGVLLASPSLVLIPLSLLLVRRQPRSIARRQVVAIGLVTTGSMVIFGTLTFAATVDDQAGDRAGTATADL